MHLAVKLFGMYINPTAQLAGSVFLQGMAKSADRTNVFESFNGSGQKLRDIWSHGIFGCCGCVGARFQNQPVPLLDCYSAAPSSVLVQG